MRLVICPSPKFCPADGAVQSTCCVGLHGMVPWLGESFLRIIIVAVSYHLPCRPHGRSRFITDSTYPPTCLRVTV